MRHYRVILCILIVGCKVSTPTQTGIYTEDLSVHRPQALVPEDMSSIVEEAESEEFVALTGHIKAELDSINNISIRENKAGKLVEGYVVQVYSGNSREQANNIRSRLRSSFPELKPKISYHRPNFRVRVGKFTDRLEATRTYESIKRYFPRALLIPARFRLVYE